MNKVTHQSDTRFEVVAAFLGFVIAALMVFFLYNQLMERVPFQDRSIVEPGPVPEPAPFERRPEKPETLSDKGPIETIERPAEQIVPPQPAPQQAIEKPLADENESAVDSDPENKVQSDHISDLRSRKLIMPVQNVKAGDLRDSFSEARGGSRVHEAVDILAPRNTPVLAVEDGKIARLWMSDYGGITIYQFDPDEAYVYYYAHLERYVNGLKEGDEVKKGETIGYVGTSGNAPPNTPHLHFTIFKLTEEKQWWKGTAINPFLIYR